MSAVALVNQAKAEARAAAALEKESGGTESSASNKTSAPQIPDRALPATEAGFPKRSKGATTGAGSPLPGPSTDGPAPMRSRDADHVKNSLMSYRAAVKRGRSQGDKAEMSNAVATTAGATSGESNEQDQNNDDVQPGSAQ